ncbi:MAG: hypothetical protein QM809_00655 [Gordonia sp. (in: high G+C Gram-positive bacteria)]|uniref:hypothetical protein n=1 Tax=Gordonia sp. (in: high G+C Gram-positive bacteria) TaxID=84139 RepID=UPI0039E356CA
MKHPDRGPALELDHVEALATSAEAHELAALIPRKPEDSPGPARKYHEVLLVYYLDLAGNIGSHRRAARVLGKRAHWRRLRKGARKFGIELPKRPPTRDNCEDARRRLTEVAGDDPNTGICEKIRALFASGARNMAHRHGALDDTGRVSITDPPRGNTLFADGKVITSLFGEKARAARRERGQHVDGALHVQGGDSGTKTYGMKYWHVSVRPNDFVNSRIFLDVRYVPDTGYGGEAGVGTNALLDLRRAEPGATTLCYDGALRGTHLHKLATAGYLVVSPPHGTTAKSRPLEEVADCTCGRKHRLVTVDGCVAVRRISDSGKPLDIRAKGRLAAIRRTTGHTDWYTTIELPCGNTRRVKINAEEPSGQYRIERLRQAAKDDRDPNALYDRIYGRREDAESANNIIERTLHGGRAISHTAAGQFLVMLGHALGRNAYADLLWRRERHADTGPPHAA